MIRMAETVSSESAVFVTIVCNVLTGAVIFVNLGDERGMFKVISNILKFVFVSCPRWVWENIFVSSDRLWFSLKSSWDEFVVAVCYCGGVWTLIMGFISFLCWLIVMPRSPIGDVILVCKITWLLGMGVYFG